MAPEPGPPQVFLSHASEDKAFAVDLASRLRQRGVDAWLDRWEIAPGDSLVEKIFDEGIARARAVIVVLSRHSVVKPWVREELNAAMVRKIDAVSKLIPVVIDDCEVPACLRATVWEKIDDPKSYEPSLERIVLSIFGQTDKPPVGEPPPFARAPAVTIGDLTPVDGLVLQAACELCLEEGYELQVFDDALLARTAELGVSGDATRESLEILVGRGYLRSADPVEGVFVAPAGFEAYLKAHRPGYPDLLKQFASCVVNKAMRDGAAIAESLQLPRVLLDHVLEVFEERKWIVVDRYGGGGWEIPEGGVSPEMKRWLGS